MKNKENSIFTDEELGKTYLAERESKSSPEEIKNAYVCEIGKTAKRVERYNDFRDAKFHQNLIRFGRIATMKPLPIRLLMMLTQTVATMNPDEVSATVYEFSTQAVMKYLKINKNSGTKYDDLLRATADFRKAGIDFRDEQKNGSEYQSINFVQSVRFADYDDVLRMTVNPMAVEYLVALHKYVATKPKYFLQLSSTLQMCLYLLLKYKAGSRKKSEWEISFYLLKKDLRLDNIPSYDERDPRHKNDAWRNFYTRVLGLAKPKNEWIAPETRARWNYLEKDGEPTGTIATINKYTDINVSVYCYRDEDNYFINFNIQKKDDLQLSKVKPKTRKSNGTNQTSVKCAEPKFEDSVSYPLAGSPAGEPIFDYSIVRQGAELQHKTIEQFLIDFELEPAGVGLYRKKKSKN